MVTGETHHIMSDYDSLIKTYELDTMVTMSKNTMEKFQSLESEVKN